MKTKILLTSALAISIACPAISATLPAIENCVEDEIGTATGPASLEADWTANRITLLYDGNGVDVIGGDGTCTYATSFTLPQAPTKTGYNFAGWKVKSGSAQCTDSLDISKSATWDANHVRWKPFEEGYAMLDEFETENSSDLSNGEWAITFSYGTIKGKARCSTVGLGYDKGQIATGEVTDNLGSGQYCWCQMTSYKPAGEEMCSASPSSWVFFIDYQTGPYCSYSCVDYCAHYVSNSSSALHTSLINSFVGQE